MPKASRSSRSQPTLLFASLLASGLEQGLCQTTSFQPEAVEENETENNLLVWLSLGGIFLFVVAAIAGFVVYRMHFQKEELPEEKDAEKATEEGGGGEGEHHLQSDWHTKSLHACSKTKKLDEIGTLWFYMAPDGSYHGPFENGKMRHWFLEQYFPEDTMIQIKGAQAHPNPWVKIKEAFPTVSEAFQVEPSACAHAPDPGVTAVGEMGAVGVADAKHNQAEVIGNSNAYAAAVAPACEDEIQVQVTGGNGGDATGNGVYALPTNDMPKALPSKKEKKRSKSGVSISSAEKVSVAEAGIRKSGGSSKSREVPNPAQSSME